MAGSAFLRYSHRAATQRTGGRYDLRELWLVPNITNTQGGLASPASTAWQHEALNATGLPKLGDVSHSGGYICTSLVCRSLSDQGTAEVDVTYIEDPLTLVTEVNYFGQSKPKPAWRGIAQMYGGEDDTPPPAAPPAPGTDDLYDDDSIQDIRNSAGDRYNPPVQYEVALQRVEVSFRASLQWFDTGEADVGSGGDGEEDDPGDEEDAGGFSGDWGSYLKHWNQTDFKVTQTDPDNSGNSSSVTFPAGTLMLVDVRAPLVKEPYFHRFVTCIFLYDPDMWCQRLPDMGPRCLKYLATRGGEVVQIEPPGFPTARVAVTDTMGRPFGGSAELDGEGCQAIPDSSGKMPPANIFMWWPVDDGGNLLSAEFDDLDLFTPERTASV
jgi:hypothetical protein